MRKRITLLSALMALISLSCAFAAPKPVLKPGEKMVFLGDSITEQKIYTRYVMNYFTMHYPDAKIDFRNAGWGGDTSPGGLGRLQRDVLSLKPNVVSICFGMNDARYTAFDQGNFDAYMTGMKGLVTELKKAGVRVVLLTPGVVDTDSAGHLKGYNDTLRAFADGVVTLAKEEKLPVYNIHTDMLAVQTKAKSEKSDYTMIPDGVHPAPAGQSIMSCGLLAVLGENGLPSSLTVDAKKRKLSGVKCKVTDLKVTKDSISFTRTDESLPVFLEPDILFISRYYPKVAETNKYNFRVKGLSEGNWKLVVDGIEVGTFTAAQLAGTVDLSSYPSPWQKLGQEINKLSDEQEQLYFRRWRHVSLAPLPAGGQTERDVELKKLDDEIEAKASARMKAVSNRTWNWTLTKVQ